VSTSSSAGRKNAEKSFFAASTAKKASFQVFAVRADLCDNPLCPSPSSFFPFLAPPAGIGKSQA